jgi:hypothetical protein
MDQAKSVLSTPSTNTSAASRRTFLAQAAGAAAGGAALGASLPLPAPSDVAERAVDAELIELGTRFEPLLDQFYIAHRRWSGCLAQANADHDEEYGTPAERNYGYPPEVAAAFSDSCKRSGTDEASDALSAVHRQMVPLANAINSAPVNSIEGLRAKAMVIFWEVAPLFAGSRLYSFEDALPFQWLFTTVAELCGLKDKIAATGYRLPESDFAYESDDEAEEA